MRKAMIAGLLLALTVSGCIDQAYTSTPTKTPRPIVPHTPFPTLVATTQAPTAAPTTQAPTPPTADVTQLAASPSTPGTAIALSPGSA